MGRNPAGSPRRRAESDRPCAVRRRLGNAGRVGRSYPALAHAHARIRSIDTSKAVALPGVKAVGTSADFPEQKFEYVGPERVAQNFWHMTRNIMAREKVLYEGHAVAAVAATSKAIADERCR